MSKAILILDRMPTSCQTCQLNSGKESEAFCDILDDWTESSRRDPDCPLFEMSEKKAISGTQIIKEAHEQNIDPARYAGYCAGWNDCLEAIGGDSDVD